jgi:hypothetical protein
MALLNKISNIDQARVYGSTDAIEMNTDRRIYLFLIMLKITSEGDVEVYAFENVQVPIVYIANTEVKRFLLCLR